MKEKLFALAKRFRMLLSYFSHSVISTVFDTIIVWLLLDGAVLPLAAANTVGVVAGFVIGFFLDVKRTFSTRYTPLSFGVYFLTFLLGLGLADLLIVVSYDAAAPYLSPQLTFLFSKGVSIALPFFALYFIRKYAYRLVRKYEEGKERHE